jgi:hypothetical protein
MVAYPYLSVILLVAGGFFAAGAKLSAQSIAVTDASSTFNAVVKADGTIMTDGFADQQTGQFQSDLISLAAGTSVYVNGTLTTLSADAPGFFVKSGTITGQSGTFMMFRTLYQDKNQNKTFQGSFTMLGSDLTGDGKPDFIFGIDYRNATPTLAFLKPGTGANDAPNTTTSATYTTTASRTLTVGTTAAYASTSTNYDDASGNGAANRTVTFAISFSNLQQAIRDMGTVNGTNFSTFTVTAATAMSFMLFTTQQDNAFNQDIFGGNITSTSSATWTSLGAFSDTFTASGGRVPEPATYLQVGAMGLAALGMAFWRRGRRLPGGGRSG